VSINQPYHTWVSRILQLRPTERITRVRNMAQLLDGIFHRKSVHLSKVATQIISNATLPSVTRRLSRFLDNPAVQVREWYESIARALLQSAAGTVGEIRLLTDGTKVGFGHQLLMISLAYRRRALPIAWTWIRARRGHSSAITQLALLGYVHRLIPRGSRVLLAGDSEFGAIPVLQQLEAWGWFYVLRQKASHQVKTRTGQDWQDFGQLVQRPSQSVWGDEAELTRKHAHPTNLLAYWQVGEAEPWLLATNLPHQRIALQVYGRRMWTEEMFGDLKGHGFDLESTHLQHISRLSRLTLAVMLLYVWVISIGSTVIKNGERSWVDRAERRDLSIFQVGLRWIERRLTNTKSISMRLCPTCNCKLSGS
jgi:hypothetical protein